MVSVSGSWGHETRQVVEMWKEGVVFFSLILLLAISADGAGGRFGGADEDLIVIEDVCLYLSHTFLYV